MHNVSKQDLNKQSNADRVSRGDVFAFIFILILIFSKLMGIQVIKWI